MRDAVAEAEQLSTEVQPAYRELILGAGWRLPEKQLKLAGNENWSHTTAVDISYRSPQQNTGGFDWLIQHDLRKHPLPFGDNLFDEIHAYDILEHLAQQGDVDFFLREWSEYWRIIKPGGVFIGSVPEWTSPWAWGDPGHTRVVQLENFVFLSQQEYEKQVGKTPMSDYRQHPWFYRADWRLQYYKSENEKLTFALHAVK